MNRIYICLIILISSTFFSCNSEMIDKGINSMLDPRVPEINVKQGQTDIPSGSEYALDLANGITVDETCEPVFFTIENTGTADMELGEITISGENSEEFAIQSQPEESILPPGTNTTFSITLTPQSADPRTAEIVITTNDFDEAEYSFTITGRSKPVPIFSARLRRGIAPLTVEFIDKSAGDVTSREWDFGDGTISSETDPSHVFVNPGSFTVTLSITGSGGYDYTYKIDYVTVANSIKHTIEKYPENMEKISVSAGDFNADSNNDIISTRRWSDTGEVALWKNLGNGSFLKTTISGTFPEVQSADFACIAGDTDKDIIAVSYQDAYWWENNGDGTFNLTGHLIDTVESLNKNTAIFAERFNPTGFSGSLDFAGAVWDAGQNKLAWWENDGSGNFSWTSIANISDDLMFILPVDFDKTNGVDIFTAQPNLDTITWWKNNGADPPVFTSYTVTSSFNNPESVITADIDKDGDLDLIASASGADEIAWWENNNNYTTNPVTWIKHTITTKYRDPMEISAADIDNDGDPDILGALNGTEKLLWWENNGGVFTEHIIDNYLNNAMSIRAAYIDSDNYIDAVAAGGSEIAWWNIKIKNWWYPVSLNDSFDTVRSIRSADIDGDGDTDIITTALYGNEVAWCENDGSDRFKEKRVVSDTLPGAWYADAADLDLDGDLDIVGLGVGVIGNDSIKSKLSWWENRGGSFSEHVLADTIDMGVFAAANDIEKDGDMDILYLDSGTDAAGLGKVILMKNGGNMNFSPELIIDNLPYSFSFCLADLDNDGYQDLIYIRLAGNEISWMSNNRDGTFGSEQVIDSTFHEPWVIMSCDIDGDGDIDVIAAGDQEAAWWGNNGSGLFSAKHVITNLNDITADNPSIYTADINGDNHIDVVLRSGSIISWYKNDGSAAPAFLKNIVSSDFTQSFINQVYAADFDNDGDPDILATQGNEIVALENNNVEYGQ